MGRCIVAAIFVFANLASISVAAQTPDSIPSCDGLVAEKSAVADNINRRIRELIAIPPTYEWVEGEIEGHTKEYAVIPAIYETGTKTIIETPACYESTKELNGKKVLRPELKRQTTYRYVRTPAQIVERYVPNEIKNGRTRKMVKPAYVKSVTP